jgi:hypothetical protein
VAVVVVELLGLSVVTVILVVVAKRSVLVVGNGADFASTLFIFIKRNWLPPLCLPHSLHEWSKCQMSLVREAPIHESSLSKANINKNITNNNIEKKNIDIDNGIPNTATITRVP